MYGCVCFVCVLCCRPTDCLRMGLWIYLSTDSSCKLIFPWNSFLMDNFIVMSMLVDCGWIRKWFSEMVVTKVDTTDNNLGTYKTELSGTWKKLFFALSVSCIYLGGNVQLPFVCVFSNLRFFISPGCLATTLHRGS